MIDKPPIVERAYQIAKSGSVSSAEDLIRTLQDEGYESSRMLIAGTLRQKCRQGLPNSFSGTIREAGLADRLNHATMASHRDCSANDIDATDGDTV